MYLLNTRTRSSRKSHRRQPRLQPWLENLEYRLAPAVLNPGAIIVADRTTNGGTVFEVNPETGSVRTIATISGIDQVEVGKNGELYLRQHGNNIISYNIDNENIRTIFTGPEFYLGGNIGGMGIDSDGSLLFSVYTQTRVTEIHRVDSETSQQTVIARLNGYYRDPQVDKDGSIIIAGETYPLGGGRIPGIFRVDRMSGVATLIGGSSIISNNNLNSVFTSLSSDYSNYYVTVRSLFSSPVTGYVYKVDAATKSTSLVSMGGNLEVVVGSDIDKFNNIVIASLSDSNPPKIVKVSSTTGAQSVLASGPPLFQPYDIAIVPEANDIEMLPATLASPLFPNAGPTVNFSYRTTGLNSQFAARLYLSADKTFDPDPAVDVPVGDTQMLTPSAPSSPLALGSFFLPNPIKVSKDRPYLLVVADPWSQASPRGSIEESNDEGNNVAAVALPKLDVKIAPPLGTPAGTTTFYISAEPRMPTINAHAKVLDLPPTFIATAEFKWETSVDYTPPPGRSRRIAYQLFECPPQRPWRYHLRVGLHPDIRSESRITPTDRRDPGGRSYV